MGHDARANLRGLPGGPGLIGAGGGRISTQPAEIHDALGRALQVGDIIDLSIGKTPFFTVQAIERVIESGVPDGLMDIVVVCRMKFRAPRAQPQQEFVRVMTAEETGLVPQAVKAEPVDENRPSDPVTENQP